MLHRSHFWGLKKVDVCVIGGGPAGIATALRAVDYKKKACIVEANRIGGADLWNGALQSKTLWEMSKFVRLMTGQTASRFMKPLMPLPPIDSSNAQKAIKNASELRYAQIVHQLKIVDIDVIEGYGSFMSPQSVDVQLASGGTERVEADYFVIACGAQPRKHVSVTWDGKVVFTSDDIMNRAFPKSIVIIGAGVIGCEFASIFANFGMTKVNVIEKSNRILPMEDDDVAEFVQKLLENKGVTFHHHSALESNKVKNGQFHYTLRNLIDNKLTTHIVDNALVSIGREPNLSGLGLENIGVGIQRGKLERDQFNRVKPHKHIYACGDVATKFALVNVGELEGRSCIDHIYHPHPEGEFVQRLDNLSTIMFLDQEVAAVGLNEQQCRKQNIAYKMARYGYEFVARAVAMGNTRGFVKLIVTNDREMQVLGVRAIGPHASSVIELASLAIHNKETLYNLSELRTAYPTVTQGFQECVNMLLGTSLLKPNVFPQLVLQEWSPPNFDRGRAYQGDRI
ncbi:putative dihydrolipoamide dehydrogenase [Trypanosoma cruzi]|uniref:Dihydrolipoamide dehydrogenase, putative n=2 Tax=Trypanosoma cruzi TaxID=5693 RepID=Q4CQX3_TRYCC|nr:dihydrolipoamide dehydrogenase, putative [Trypanosoma cruzi]EAN82673.1 dihydrolipoamide dehydrogenase, putative [Trypanosoma cruzi]PWV18532.1 putative dihydrolipoamide dehydrogenase [Trypanosoma cruzi]RNC38592.1 putative mitochondrial dihydrolipoamide dehydrogenase, putative (GCVL-1) [Trypanosoma cruzi]|eukprot:XP_804524.1 dihydrolipoamide dehydrogenase [Trypanosoma cruzi strain CL Brener]